MLCGGTETDACLTQPQVDALKKIYAGPVNTQTGVRIAFGMERGGENAINPDLSAAWANGTKIIEYHGWNDPVIQPQQSVAYYESAMAPRSSVSPWIMKIEI